MAAKTGLRQSLAKSAITRKILIIVIAELKPLTEDTNKKKTNKIKRHKIFETQDNTVHTESWQKATPPVHKKPQGTCI